MTIQELGLIGELIGALETIGTLIYLGIQIRSNTRMIQSQSQRESQSTNAAYAMALAENSQLVDVFQRGLASFESLTESERIQFTFVFSRIVGVVEVADVDVRKGVTEVSQIERAMAGVGLLLAAPRGRSCWRAFSARGGYTEGFSSFVASNLADRPDARSREPEAAAYQAVAADVLAPRRHGRGRIAWSEALAAVVPGWRTPLSADPLGGATARHSMRG